MTTDALVLKHQAISTHSADWIFIVLDWFHTKIADSLWTAPENKISFEKNWPSCLRVKLKKFTVSGWHFRLDSNFIKQCSKLSQEGCQSFCLESQIINIKLKKFFQKVTGPPPKLSASGRRTGNNLEHCIKTSSLIHWDLVVIRQHRAWSTFVQIMACCLMAPCHCPCLCWLITSKV